MKLSQLFVLESARRLTVEQVFSARRPFEHTEEVQKGGFFRSGWAHDRDKFPLLDGQVDVPKDISRIVLGTVDLKEVTQFDQRHCWLLLDDHERQRTVGSRQKTVPHCHLRPAFSSAHYSSGFRKNLMICCRVGSPGRGIRVIVVTWVRCVRTSTLAFAPAVRAA